MSKRRFWGWGYDDAGPTPDQQSRMAETLADRFGLDGLTLTRPPTVAELDLPAPRLLPPSSIADLCTTDPEERAGHTYGKSFRDVVRALARDFRNPPDLVRCRARSATSPRCSTGAPTPAPRQSRTAAGRPSSAASSPMSRTSTRA